MKLCLRSRMRVEEVLVLVKCGKWMRFPTSPLRLAYPIVPSLYCISRALYSYHTSKSGFRFTGWPSCSQTSFVDMTPTMYTYMHCQFCQAELSKQYNVCRSLLHVNFVNFFDSYSTSSFRLVGRLTAAIQTRYGKSKSSVTKTYWMSDRQTI